MTEPSRYWFHILKRPGPEARHHHAARLAEKAWQEGDRVGLLCNNEDDAQQLDDTLWAFRPDAFLPHEIITANDQTPSTRVAALTCDPSPQDWDTLIVLSTRLPTAAEQFKRLALIASNDDESLQQARNQYRQLKDLGVSPQVHDQRSG